MPDTPKSPLDQPLTLRCGTVLKNRIAKAAMSDSLGDGAGGPTNDQIRLYERWAKGGLALSIIGEVQGTPHFAEKPGNLILNSHSDREQFERLATAGATDNALLWLQLGHAGAMADAPISTPKGPSALELPGLICGALSLDEIHAVPAEFARTASLAKEFGFGGVELHAAHGQLCGSLALRLKENAHFNKEFRSFQQAFAPCRNRRAPMRSQVVVRTQLFT